MKTLDVINGNARWSADCADALEWLRALPDDSIDLLFTSPPYELARTYGIKEKMVGGQKWVDWMVEVVRAAAPKVKGLIAINGEGQTRSYRYSCVPFLLMADLHRAGFHLRRPIYFHRYGIPGSGGPDWMRADVEPIICIARPGKLAWSDNTSCGHAPKWAPDGAMSYRNGDGVRKNARGYSGGKVNQWGMRMGNVSSTATRKPDGTKQKPGRPSHRIANGKGITGGKGQKILTADHQPRFRHDDNGNVKGAHERDICAIANPGNLIHCDVGGGQMGHDLAHENEAPFPLDLPAFFIKSFCPPDGIVADPFMGSGTTIDAAIQNGRRGIGCDIRQSQVDLTERRMATVTPCFSELA